MDCSDQPLVFFFEFIKTFMFNYAIGMIPKDFTSINETYYILSLRFWSLDAIYNQQDSNKINNEEILYSTYTAFLALHLIHFILLKPLIISMT